MKLYVFNPPRARVHRNNLIIIFANIFFLSHRLASHATISWLNRMYLSVKTCRAKKLTMPLKSVCMCVCWHVCMKSRGGFTTTTKKLRKKFNFSKINLTNSHCYWANPHFSCSNRSDYSECRRKWWSASEMRLMRAIVNERRPANWHQLLAAVNWMASPLRSPPRVEKSCRWAYWSNISGKSQCLLECRHWWCEGGCY